MCPMDSIAEFIFVHNGKASRVHDHVSPLLWLCLQLHPHSGDEPMRWAGWQCSRVRWEVDSSAEWKRGGGG